MYKIRKSIIFASLLLIGITASCNLPASSAPAETETPAPLASPTAAASPTSAPTEFIPTASATPQLAPLCASDMSAVTPAQCQVPLAETGGSFCQKKKPFNLIFVNKGSTYEVLTKGFKCFDNGLKDGRQILACTGYMGTQFEVNVCDPSCVIPTAQASATQCPPDYNYNNVQGCCAQGFEPYQPNCVTLKLETIRCVVNCWTYKKKSTCGQNSIACTWDSATRTCKAR